MKKSILIMAVLTLLAFAGCVKSTIDMNKVSENTGLSPTMVMAVNGEVTLSDVVESEDPILIGTDKSIKLVFSQDSVINFGLDDFYDELPATSLSKTFPLVDIALEDVNEYIPIEPGNNIKLKEMSVINGSVDYTIKSYCTFDTEIHLLFSSITSESNPLADIITVPAGATVTGAIDLSNYLIDLTTNPLTPYNNIPVTYSIYVSGSPVFTPSDSVNVDIGFVEPDFDYVKGYFGVNETSSEKDTLETGLDDIFSHITGSLYLYNPKITVNYDNSFGIPLRVSADVVGENSEKTISLDRDPVDLDHPVSESVRDVSGSFVIDNTNSTLPDLVSMIPDLIIFGGDATSNPDGETATDNIVFPDSRFIAGVELEAPFDFSVSDIQLSDTTENFLVNNDNGESPIINFSKLRIDMYIENGFPLGGDITIALYDSTNSVILEQISTEDFFAPAEVDLAGRVSEPSIHNSSIEFTSDFLAAAEEADNIIFTFTLYTTGHGSKEVKIYSDYSLLFRAALLTKVEIRKY